MTAQGISSASIKKGNKIVPSDVELAAEASKRPMKANAIDILTIAVERHLGKDTTHRYLLRKFDDRKIADALETSD